MAVELDQRRRVVRPEPRGPYGIGRNSLSPSSDARLDPVDGLRHRPLSAPHFVCFSSARRSGRIARDAAGGRARRSRVAGRRAHARNRGDRGDLLQGRVTCGRECHTNLLLEPSECVETNAAESPPRRKGTIHPRAALRAVSRSARQVVVGSTCAPAVSRRAGRVVRGGRFRWLGDTAGPGTMGVAVDLSSRDLSLDCSSSQAADRGSMGR
jgi:hypothetical protein